MEKTKVEKLKEMMKAKKEAEAKKTEEEKAGAEDKINIDEMLSQIKSAEEDAKAHYDKLLRVMAEFENYRKRIEREKAEHTKYAGQNIIADMLLPLDDLDRVIEHLPKDESSEVRAISEGISLVQNHMLSAMAKHGLSCVDVEPGQQFDPSIHEAVSHIQSKDYPEGTIVQVHRKGYQLHDRLIRAPMVSVSKGE